MSFGVVFIEVCDANAAWVPELQDLEDEFSGVAILESECMSECELCAARPYVFFNGTIISSETTSELLEILRQQIRCTLETYDIDT